MSKKLVLLIISILCFTALTGCWIVRSDLSGDIIIGDGHGGTSHSIIKYNPATNKFESVEPGLYYEVEYNDDKSKILCYRFLENSEVRRFEICEYDIKSKKFGEPIFIPGDSQKFEGSVKYVPNSDRISFVLDYELHIYDRSSGTLTKLFEVAFNSYSWDNTGKKLLYSDYDENIYIYDMESNEKRKILTGICPVYSSSNEYIAYIGIDQRLTVYNVNTGKKWRTVPVDDSARYIFSPDDKYILLGTEYADLMSFPHYTLYILDYKTGKKKRLFGGEGNVPSLDWK
ncbi:hypothetical protein CTHBC1_0003 [Acetivibrio thermocellus BC1]|nr:hypothetical protein CTHBC1_0003 [Acetivibrio thermocellus BC1]